MSEKMDALKPDPHNIAKLVFECECGRVQRYAPQYQSGGVTIEEAESNDIGWDFNLKRWRCPFCSGAWDKTDGWNKP